MKKIAFALAAFGLASGIATTVHAGDLAAYRGQKVDLGGVNGTAYYTIEKGGYRVVATLADAGAKVMRFEAVLAPGQSVVRVVAGGFRGPGITDRDHASW